MIFAISIAVFLYFCMVLVFVAGALISAGRADDDLEHLEPHDLMDSPVPPRPELPHSPAPEPERVAKSLRLVCSWCEAEQGIVSNPNDSHTICLRHKAELLAEHKRLIEVVQGA